jgi:uncharacterized protein with von Willebrand factor type A (vWA) domain
MASLAVSLFSGIGAGRDAATPHHLFRVLRRLELAELSAGVARSREEAEAGTRSRAVSPVRSSRSGSRSSARCSPRSCDGNCQVRGADAAIDAFHDVPIETSTSPRRRRRAAPDAGGDPPPRREARGARRPPPAAPARLDVRRTMRRSLAAGGVPLDPAFRFRRASKPDVYLLCDISGSMAEFARFSMSLLYAMKGEFSRIRLFVFVDGIDEVTHRFNDGSDWLAPRNLLYGSDVVAADGHSDYGNVFERFWHLYGHADLDPRSTVIITGGVAQPACCQSSAVACQSLPSSA